MSNNTALKHSDDDNNGLEPLHYRIERDAATLLYQNGQNGVFVTAIAASVLTFGFSSAVPNSIKLSWWGLMIAVLVIRFGDISYWNKRIVKTAFNGSYYKKRFGMGTIVTSFIWAAYPLLSFEYLSTLDFACTMIVLSAMAAGASTVLSAYKPLAMTYSLFMLLPTSVMGLFSAQDEVVYLGLLGFSFCAVMMLSARKSSLFASHAMQIHNENINLVLAMDAEKREVSELNESLECKVAERTEALKQLASRDNLTGLLNRKAFTKELEKYFERIQQAEPENLDIMTEEPEKVLALYFIDLDGFKEINDIKGHASGDKTLSVISDRLRHLEGFEDICCRWGGDEFISCNYVSSEEEALARGDEIFKAISKPILADYDVLQIGATIGIALYPEHGATVDDLIRAADLAMFSKKRQNHGGSSLFNEELQALVNREQVLTQQLQFALNKNLFTVLYQPIVGVKGQTLIFEALLRWQTDMGEQINPEEFIPLAEASGAIIQIGAWVLKQACIEAASWQFDHDAVISVNVSQRQLMDSAFLFYVEEALSESGLDPKRLHLEITESLFAEDKSKTVQKLTQLRKKGIQISIDDFGTGFSSLSQLQMLPVDQVKIDKAFVQDMGVSGRAIIEATVSIAKAMNYSVVAEGIENKAERDALIELGADYLQGFYYSRPLASDAIARWHEQSFSGL